MVIVVFVFIIPAHNLNGLEFHKETFEFVSKSIMTLFANITVYNFKSNY